VRSVSRIDARLKESEKLGFKIAYMPIHSLKHLTLSVKAVETVSNLTRQLFGAATVK
jgi:predicted ATP-dependent serine protease